MFRELCSEEKIKRLEIDPKLVEPFKNVMGRMEDYFVKKGYDSQRNYSAMFDYVLLRPKEGTNIRYGESDKDGGYYECGVWKRKFRFVVEEGLERQGRRAYLYKTPENQIEKNGYGKIAIGTESLRESQIAVEREICHEFIHLLVELYLKDLVNPLPDDIFLNGRGRFIIEALTELLVHEIYPEVTSTYIPQVKMISYANFLTKNVNNFEKYLMANVDFKGDNYDKTIWDKFVDSSLMFHTLYLQMKKRTLSANEIELMNNSYIQTQRFLIQHVVHYRMNDGTSMNIDEYSKFRKHIIESSPAPDPEWQEEYLKEVDEIYLQKKLNIDKSATKVLASTLREYMKFMDVAELESPNVFSTTFNGEIIQFKKKDNGKWSIYVAGKILKDDAEDCLLGIGFSNRQLSEEERNNILGNKYLMNNLYGVIDMTKIKSGKIIIGKLANLDQSSIEQLRRGRVQIDSSATVEIDVSDEKYKKNREIAKTYKKLFENPTLSTDLKILFSQNSQVARVEKVELPTLEFDFKPPTLAYILYLTNGDAVIVDSNGKKFEVNDTKKDKKVARLIGLVGNADCYAYQTEPNKDIDRYYIADLDEKRKILIYSDSNGKIQIAESDGALAFVGEKEEIYDSKTPGIYSIILPPATVVNSKGYIDIVNVEEYKQKQETSLAEAGLIEFLKGLKPEKKGKLLDIMEETIGTFLDEGRED